MTYIQVTQSPQGYTNKVPPITYAKQKHLEEARRISFFGKVEHVLYLTGYNNMYNVFICLHELALVFQNTILLF